MSSTVLTRMVVVLCLGTGGCWAPLHSHGIPASELPDSYRIPTRAIAPDLILSSLTQNLPTEYRLGPGDVLEATIPGLFPRDELRPLRVQVLGDGTIQLPLLSPLHIGGKTISDAQVFITEAYGDGFLIDPRVSLVLVQRGVTDVVVLGFVNRPGAYPLPRFENDISHALAAAGGLRDDAASVVEVHRRAIPAAVPPAPEPGPIELQGGWTMSNAPPPWSDSPASTEPPAFVTDSQPAEVEMASAWSLPGLYPWSEPESLACPQPASLPVGIDFVLRIPLRGDLTPTVCTPDGEIRPVALTPDDLVLRPGDVVRVPEQVDEAFYVVGPLSPANFVRFSVRDQDREVGGGFLLPKNRDIDVVTAVTMAGYIDPINSPTTVTVHRMRPGQAPLLIVVDLIKARYSPQENIYVEPGDIIYLNPDAPWYFRRLFDRVVEAGVRIPYDRAVRRAIDP